MIHGWLEYYNSRLSQFHGFRLECWPILGRFLNTMELFFKLKFIEMIKSKSNRQISSSSERFITKSYFFVHTSEFQLVKASRPFLHRTPTNFSVFKQFREARKRNEKENKAKKKRRWRRRRVIAVATSVGVASQRRRRGNVDVTTPRSRRRRRFRFAFGSFSMVFDGVDGVGWCWWRSMVSMLPSVESGVFDHRGLLSSAKSIS